MTNRFTQKAQNALNGALAAASELGHTYIGSEHILLGLLSDSDSIACKLLTVRGADRRRIRDAVAELAGEGLPTRVSPQQMTPRTQKIIQESAYLSVSAGQGYIGTEHLLLALLDEHDCVAVRIMEELDLPVDELRRDVTSFLQGSPTGPDPAGPGVCASDQTSPGTGGRVRSGPASGGITDRRKKEQTLSGAPTISQFGRDLTSLAREGKLDPVIGRDTETERVVQILSRRTKNNPCLIGEPGVGKTAVVEGLAQRIADGNIPETLTGKTIVTLDLSSMVAGAKYRGEFEERFKGVMEEARRNPDIILFIDEIHTIIGAGAAEGAVDAANIIKPSLARGEIQVIGATTVTEYRRHIEKDAALERRFQPVTVGEPTKEQTLDILEGLRPKLEAHHKLTIPDEAIAAAVDLSVRYINDRFLPDKAIDLIDEAASRLRISLRTSPTDLKRLEEAVAAKKRDKEEAIKSQDFERAAALRDEEQALSLQYESARSDWSHTQDSQKLSVSANDIAGIVTQWTGIPVSRLIEGEGERLIHLEDTLRARVIGQEDAVNAVAKAIRRGRMGLKDPSRPIGSFIFLGPTGVGKTELSKALASAMFGDESAMIRLDMSEYMEKHSVSKLIGSPPGYVGFDEGGQLTEKIRRRPYTVILFDEIEKAHPDVFNILLQVLDEGMLTDSQGRRVDCRNTVIIMTSNLGASSESEKKQLGFMNVVGDDREKANRDRMMRALKDTFRPEFINRVDEIVLFRPLGKAEINGIAAILLEEVRKRIEALHIHITFDPSVAALCAAEGFDPVYGARPLKRAVVRLVEDTFSTELLEGRVKTGDRITAAARDGQVIYQKENESN
ncbi:MAG: ATP-dependent Clp protease ATP-binding subunit [Clostridia bacterium]|nr:ATP-dependent Clp protease ATP-binding subunit [Clostridia bacterium]